jgi:hypothetical protein
MLRNAARLFASAMEPLRIFHQRSPGTGAPVARISSVSAREPG